MCVCGKRGGGGQSYSESITTGCWFEGVLRERTTDMDNRIKKYTAREREGDSERER